MLRLFVMTMLPVCFCTNLTAAEKDIALKLGKFDILETEYSATLQECGDGHGSEEPNSKVNSAGTEYFVGYCKTVGYYQRPALETVYAYLSSEGHLTAVINEDTKLYRVLSNCGNPNGDFYFEARYIDYLVNPKRMDRIIELEFNDGNTLETELFRCDE